MERDALPRWDLSVIYPSLSSPEFKADVKKVSELKGIIIDNLESFSIRKLLELLNESAALVSNLDSYSAALLSTDTSNSLYMKAVSDAEEASSAYDEAWQAFVRSAARRGDEFSDEALEDYRLLLDEILTLSRHQMSEAEEKLTSDFLRLSSSSWERLQEAVTSTALLKSNVCSQPDMFSRQTGTPSTCIERTNGFTPCITRLTLPLLPCSKT